jgi:hypothetical protein
VGASTFCWAIWLSRNDVIFDKFQLKLLCMYSIEGRTDSHFGLNWKGMMKTKKQSIWHAASWRQWPWRYSPTMDGDLAIEGTANICIVQNVSLFIF